jgi:hypothetical protein
MQLSFSWLTRLNSARVFYLDVLPKAQLGLAKFDNGAARLEAKLVYVFTEEVLSRVQLLNKLLLPQWGKSKLTMNALGKHVILFVVFWALLLFVEEF